VATLRADLSRAGLPAKDEDGSAYTAHSFRHTYGTLLLRAGKSLAEVQRLLRHSTPVLTANTYGHLLHDDLRAVVAGSDALDFGAATLPQTLPYVACKGPAGVHPARLVARATDSRGRSQLRVLPQDAHGKVVEAPPGIEPGCADLQSAA
jgi:hypothetical protein